MRDQLGNTYSTSKAVWNIDKTPPTVSGITGNPTEWTNEPQKITVTAQDGPSGRNAGLHAQAYSWDGGATWQAENYKVFDANGIVELQVRDAVGNITRYPFTITRIDTTPPELYVSYLGISDDRKSAITALYGADNCSKTLLYSFDYDPADPYAAYWSTNNQMPLKFGVTVTVACKDELGNTTYREVTPRVSSVGGVGNGTAPIFVKNVLPLSGVTFGPLSIGKYLDAAGTLQSYGTYTVNGVEVTGYRFEIEAATNGGVLTGSALLDGVEYPVYWDAEGTQTTTEEGGTGYITIDAANFVQSQRNILLKVVLKEYSDTTLSYIFNTDKVTATVSIDVTGPVTGISYLDLTNSAVLSIKDTISGVDTAQYRINEGAWVPCTNGETISMTTNGYIEVEATDKLGNTSTTRSQYITVGNPTGSSDLDGNGEVDDTYRSPLFNHYLVGA